MILSISVLNMTSGFKSQFLNLSLAVQLHLQFKMSDTAHQF